MHHPVGPCHQHKIIRQGAGSGSSGADAFHRQIEIIRGGGGQGDILDRNARQPDFRRQPHGLGAGIGIIAKAVFKIARYRHVHSGDQVLGMGKGFVTGDLAQIGASQGKSMRGG